MRLVVLLALLGSASQLARAEPCADPEARLARAQGALDHDAHAGRIHAWAWGVGYGALALGQAGLALATADHGERAGWIVGASESFLGLVPLVLAPLPALGDAATLRRDARAPTDRCAAAAAGDRLLERSRKDEAFNRGWLAHGAIVAVNATGLLVLGLGYDRWGSAAIGALAGIAVGEVALFTRPTAALHAGDAAGLPLTLAPTALPGGLGVGLVGGF